MFKKKIIQQDNEDREQTESKTTQIGNGIEEKLNSIINNNNRILQSRGEQFKTNYQTQPSGGFFSKYSHKKPTQTVATWSNKQSLQNSLKNIPIQITKAPVQKKSVSFENQLKGLIKIIYQKEKEIENLKLSIKEASGSKIGVIQCKNCMKNGFSSSQIIDDISSQSISLNIRDIKETTGKIIQLEEKQSQLHEIIDFLMKKQEDSNKKIKQITLRNRQLLAENDKLTENNKQLTMHITNLSQQQQSKQYYQQLEITNQIQCLKQQLKQKNDEILKLNSDILKIVHAGKKSQNQMSQKIALLNKENRVLRNKDDEFQKNQILIDDLKDKLLQFQLEMHSHRKEKIALTQKLTQISNQKSQLQHQLVEITERTKHEKLQLQTTIQQLFQTIYKHQQTISQLQSRIINQAFQAQALQCEITLLNSRLSQSEQQSTQRTDNYNQLLQQIRLNSTNKSTIQQYKKLFQKIKLQNHALQVNHEREIKDYQENAQKIQAKMRQLQIELQAETKRFNEQSSSLRMEIKKKEEEKIQVENKTKVQLEMRQSKYVFEMNAIKEYYENEISILKQELHLTQECLSKQRQQLHQRNTLFQSNLNELQSLKDQLSYEQKLSLQNKIKLEQIQKKYQSINQHLQEAQVKLIANDQLIGELNLKIVELERKAEQNQTNHQDQSLQIDNVQCKNCVELETRLKNYELKLESEEKSFHDQIISLPTMGNLSSIQFANSSFQCKLQDLVQFSSRHILGHQNQTPKTQKQFQSKRRTTILLPLQQKSLEQDSSYVRYQDQLIKQLEKQCNEPTVEFMGRQNQKQRMELSEVKQSLKMTKQVNFQLFQEITRQQKLINQFKVVIKQFIQQQKQSQASKTKLASKTNYPILHKLEQLLLMK